MKFVNHYSFLLLLLLVAAVAAAALLRRPLELRRAALLIVVLVAGAGAFRIWGAGASSVQQVNAVTDAIGAGRPVLLEIQSPYCLGCAAAKPTVDRIEAANPALRVIRMNIQEPAGRALADRFDTRVTPTFILFDEAGVERLRRFGTILPEEVSEQLSR